MEETSIGSVKKIKVDWTSDGSGDASETTSEIYSGKLLAAITIPDGTDTPTVDYDIAVNDFDSVDVALDALADRSNTATEYVKEANLGAVAHSKLTVVVSSAGDTKKGTLHLWVR